MNLKAFEPNKVKFGKSDSNILAQTSNANKEVKHLTGQAFSPGFHSLF